MNVSAGIGIIGAASPMLQETFGGQLVSRPELGYLDIKKDAALLAARRGRRRRLRRPDLAVQHLRPHRLGVVVRRARPQGHLLHLLHARRRALRARLVRGGLEDPGALRRLLLHHRLDVRRRLRDHTGLSRRHVRHPVRRRHPRPPAHGLVDGRHPRPRDRQLPARHARSPRAWRPTRSTGRSSTFSPACWSWASSPTCSCARSIPKWHMSEAEVAAEQAKLHEATAHGEDRLVRHRQGRARFQGGAVLAPRRRAACLGRLEHVPEGARAVPLVVARRRFGRRRDAKIENDAISLAYGNGNGGSRPQRQSRDRAGRRSSGFGSGRPCSL